MKKSPLVGEEIKSPDADGSVRWAIQNARIRAER